MIYAKISFSNMGSYVVPLEELPGVIESDLEDVEQWAEDGDSITIEFVEMDEDEYSELEEFSGW